MQIHILDLLGGYFLHLGSGSAGSWKELVNKQTWEMIISH